MKMIASIFSILLLMVCAVTAYAFSPNGSKVTALTVNSANVSAAKDAEFMVDTPTACQMRLKRNSSVSNATVTKIPLRANTTSTFVVNPATSFINLSGCTNGVLVRQ